MGLNKQHIIYNHLVRSSKIYARMSIRVKFLEFVYVNDTSPLSPVTTIGTLSEVVTDEITSTATRSSPVEERTTTEFVYTSELVTKEPDIDRGIIELQSHNDTTSFFLNESSVTIDFRRFKTLKLNTTQLLLSAFTSNFTNQASKNIIQIEADVVIRSLPYGVVNLTFMTSLPPPSPMMQQHCSYWNNKRQTWSRDGLQMIGSNNTHVSCTTSHFTNFATFYYMYQDGQDETWQAPDSAFLELLTMVVAIISLTSLGILFRHLVYQSQRQSLRSLSPNTFLTLNLGVAMALNILTILLITTETGTDAAECNTKQLFLAFFTLFTQTAQLSWMACNGFELYSKIIRVANGSLLDQFPRFYRRCLSFFGWGCPLILVSVCLLLQTNGYDVIVGKETQSGTFFCWLQADTVYGVWISLYIVALTWNCVIFGKVVAVLHQLGKQNHGTGVQFKCANDILRQTRKICGLLASLGITLLLAIFITESDVAAAIFILLNGLQGFFLTLAVLVK